MEILENQKVDEQIITIDQLRPHDREEGYPKGIKRPVRKLLEIIPGLITWLFLLSPILVAILGVPEILVFYIAFLTIYWLYRGFRFMYGIIFGIRRINKEIATDWMSKIHTEYAENYSKQKYVYICPTVKEGLETLRPTFEAWANSDVDTKKISVVVAMEEKFAPASIEKFEILKKEYGDKFREMMYFVHPANIAGEVKGVKGANINWSTRNFVKLIKKRDEKLEDYLLITCDCDLRPHQKYLSAVTYKYYATPNNNHRFFATAVHTFNNNIWRVPPIIRIFSTATTIVILHKWVVSPKSMDTFSSYIVNLNTVDEVGYWQPDVGIDDTTFYWNALVRYNGDFSGVEVYIPTYSDAVENETTVKSHISLYKQQHRWGWGIIVVPTTIAGIFSNKFMPLARKFEMLWYLLDNQLLGLTVVYLITFGLPMLSFFSDKFIYTAASYNLPVLMSYILTALMFLNLPIVYYRRKVVPIPSGWSFFRHIGDFMETVLVTLNMLTFGFIPFIQAQTEMMLGRGFKKNFYATEKVEIKK